MKRRDWIIAAALAAGVLMAGCSDMRKLARTNPKVGLHQLSAPVTQSSVRAADTVQTLKIITFRKQDGTQMTLTPVSVDSLTGEKIMTVGIEQVIISGFGRRNLVERDGKINVEFIVSVPGAFRHRKWQLALDPRLQKGGDTTSLDPLVYSGDKFRGMQQGEYRRFGKYMDKIVDSTQYFEHFGDKRAYRRQMAYIADKREQYTAAGQRLDSLTPRQAMYDRQVGWTTPRERRRLYGQLRDYVRTTDRQVASTITYTPDPGDSFDHLNDYFAPRYRYEGVGVQPGGAVYTRIDGRYPEASDRSREGYLRSLSAERRAVRREIAGTDTATVRRLAAERVAYTGRGGGLVDAVGREASDSAMWANYRSRKQFAAEQLARLNAVDTNVVRDELLNWSKIYRNRMRARYSGEVYDRTVLHPYFPNARLDTIVCRADGSIDYHYSEQVPADENTSKLRLFVDGRLEDVGGRSYGLRRSDTLTYNVASMTTFVDTTTRYMQRIVLRDAEANARFYFTFPAGRATLVDTLPANRRQLLAVRALTRGLMTDPIYIIDSITLRATASPEGAWAVNERLARERAEALRRVLVSDFRTLYDSLRIGASVTIDEQGRQVMSSAGNELPNLPELLRTKSLAEDWEELNRLVRADEAVPDKEQVLAIMARNIAPDACEWQIRMKYPKAYTYISRVLYPQMRAVDFRFNLHRRGMLQDTVYTTEVDSNYMHAVELLKKRRYEQALPILRSYDDRNTALAYMSLGYDAAAYRILRAEPTASTTADVQYMLAVVAARLGEEQQAVHYFLRSVELRGNLKFRGNLDPEVARLIRKYGLFREDFQ